MGQYTSIIEIQTNVEKALKDIIEIQGRIDKLEGKEYKVDLGVDSKKLESVINNLEKMLKSLGKGTGDFKQFETLSQELSGVSKEIQSIGKAFGNIDDSGTKTLLSSIQSIDQSLAKLSQHIANVNKDFGKIGQGTSGNVQDLLPSNADFKNILSNLDLTKSKLGEIVKITKQAHSDKDGKFYESFTLTDRNGSRETYGEGSKTSKGQLLEYKYVEQDTKAAEKQAKAAEKIAQQRAKAVKEERSAQKNENQSRVDSALKQQVDAWKNIQSIREKIAKANPEDSDYVSKLQESKKIYQQQYVEANKVLKANQDLYNVQAHQQELNKAKLKTDANIAKYNNQQDTKAAEKQAKEINNKISSYTSSLQKLSLSPEIDHSFDSWKNKLDEIETAIKKLKELNKNANITDGIIDNDDLEKIKKASDEIEKLIAKATKTPQGERGWKDISVSKTAKKISDLLEENSSMADEAKAKIKAYYDELVSGNPSAPLDEIYDKCLRIVQAEHDAGRAGKSWMDIFKEKKIYGLIGQAASMFSLYDFVRYVKTGFNYVKELDTAYTEMRKVSDESKSTLKNYQASTFDIANEVGTTAVQLQNSTADFMRLGRSQQKL